MGYWPIGRVEVVRRDLASRSRVHQRLCRCSIQCADHRLNLGRWHPLAGLAPSRLGAQRYRPFPPLVRGKATQNCLL